MGRLECSSCELTNGLIEVQLLNFFQSSNNGNGTNVLGEIMPKIKGNSGAAKRFKKTGSGKFKRSQSHLRHILTKKSTKRKRHLRKQQLASSPDTKLIQRMLPYA